VIDAEEIPCAHTVQGVGAVADEVRRRPLSAELALTHGAVAHSATKVSVKWRRTLLDLLLF
jgi:hypothetical protein